jgi:hypothetical protein
LHNYSAGASKIVATIFQHGTTFFVFVIIDKEKLTRSSVAAANFEFKRGALWLAEYLQRG